MTEYIPPAAKITSGSSASINVAGVLGKTTDVVITFRRELLTTDYDAVADVYDSTGILGSVKVQGVIGKTTQGCTIRLQNTAIIAVGSVSVSVIASTL